MPDFRFEASGPGQGVGKDKRVAVLVLTQTRLAIGKEIYHKLGEPTRVILSHDKKALALQLVPTSSLTEGYVIATREDTKTGRAFIRTEQPQKYMPLGAYLPISNNIFVHESAQR